MLQFFKRLFWGRSITRKSCKRFQQYVKEIETKDAKPQIIEYDKLYHAILKDLGYLGSFGDILKRNPREIHNLQEIWNLHKLRNTLVHDLKEPKIDMKKKAENYKRVILAFLQNVSEK